MRRRRGRRDRERAAEHDLRPWCRMCPRRGRRLPCRRSDDGRMADAVGADADLRRPEPVGDHAHGAGRVPRGGRTDREQHRRRLGRDGGRRLLAGRHRRRLDGRRRCRHGCRRRCGSCCRRRRRRRFGRRDGSGRRLRCDARQERERIEVAVVVGIRPDAEVDVRDGQLRRAARADGADRVPLPDRRALRDRHRTEMGEGHGERVPGQDRDRLAAGGNAAGERDDARCRSDDRRAGGAADVDAAVLPARVRMRGIEHERCEHGPGHRPRPGAGRGDGKQEEQDHERDSTHTALLLLSVSKTESAER